MFVLVRDADAGSERGWAGPDTQGPLSGWERRLAVER
jgi:hypothetical protein